MDCNLSGSSDHGIFQVRMLEWVAISEPPGKLKKLLEKCKSKLQWVITSHRSEWPSSESLQTINAGDGAEKRESSSTVGGNVNWKRIWTQMNIYEICVAPNILYCLSFGETLSPRHQGRSQAWDSSLDYRFASQHLEQCLGNSGRSEICLHKWMAE